MLSNIPAGFNSDGEPSNQWCDTWGKLEDYSEYED